MKKITLILFLAMYTLYANATFYVVPGGAGAADGSSWANAYGDIQTAINAASTLYGTSSTPQEVWVKTGTYSTSAAAIIMKESVSLYGGFAGTETDKNQRAKGTNAWDYTNVSTLNGGAVKRAIESGGGNYTNVTIIDGFTITNGVGAGVQTAGAGGGVFLRHNLKLQNCIVTGNTATGNGGGINMLGGIISNCWIYNNTGGAGGGFYSNTASTTAATYVDNCLIERNTAPTGGGFRAQGTYTTNVDRCNIRNNYSTGNGAGMYIQGTTGAVITNSLITNNTGTNVIYMISAKMVNSTVANNEGGVYLASASTGELYNNIIVNNVTKGTTTAQGVSVVASYAAGKVKNNATWPSVAYQTWGGATDSILTTNATTALSQVAFKSPVAFRGRALANADSLSQISAADWSLVNTSICFNAGDNSLIPAGITTDFAGLSRTQNTLVDLGAYELQYYNTTVTFNTGGTVNNYTSGDTDTKIQGTQLAFTITPVYGYQVSSVLYNGTEVKTSLTNLIDGVNYYNGGTYTAPALSHTSTLVVNFVSVPTTAVNESGKTNLQVFAGDRQVQVKGLMLNDEVQIYNLAGSRLNDQKASTSTMTIPLAHGVYLLKAANQIYKVVIR